jgi:hypothetical protein
MLLKSKDRMEFQKSRSKWLKEGDANSRFFHACVKNRKKSNSIVALKKGRSWLTNPVLVRAEVVEYFKNHYKEVSWIRPNLDGIMFARLNGDQCEGLEGRFLDYEVWEVVADADGNKSPGPDGFNFNFLRNFGGYSRKKSYFFFTIFIQVLGFPIASLLTLSP